MSDLSPLILTLKLDQKTFSYFDQLRQQHFPPERNFLSAHVTLFHALPREQKSSIQQTLQDFRSHISPLTLTFTTLRFLGKGVAVEVECLELIQLRQQLATHWRDWLSRQDQQGYRPHITIQNKVAPDQARLLYDQLTSEWKAFQGTGEGLLLWYYKGGPWELGNQFDFK
ncbi:2'-5' RNA ligase family protein [Leptolyngbya sp. FACHB-671]|uniref:2'-5' RNA ligase family protein n=1 Tax=Leptolyngbya sp. FACHB-671 TaxID=2692812 RepID=UPI0016870DF8|nr:2'-5' RNA ligase family protein [Leptolyngbya sp. FACHB-671]MBD2070515.1 2'-5' RNA ligase family protein [Leptolyngbya sp. FACHB-671]